MPKQAKRNVKLGSPSKPVAVIVAKPATSTVIPAKAVKPAPAVAAPSKAADRAIARDARYLENARYSTDTVTAQTAQYLALFASAAKAGNGTFATSGFNPLAANNPENPKRNFRARAKLLADHGILARVSENTFRFTPAVTSSAVPANALPHILAARTAYANAKA